MEKPNKSILNKIRAILEKSKSAKSLGNLEEAETFAVGARRLLIKFNLTEEDVYAAERKVKGLRIEYGEIPEEGNWEPILSDVIANHCFCKSIVDRRCVVIFGKEQNLEVCGYLYHMIRETARAAASKKHKELVSNWRDKVYVHANNEEEAKILLMMTFGFTSQQLSMNVVRTKGSRWSVRDFAAVHDDIKKRTIYIKNFLLSAINSLAERLEAEVVKDSSSETAIIHLNISYIDEFLHENGVETKNTSIDNKVTDPMGAADGAEFGKTIKLVKGLK